MILRMIFWNTFLKPFEFSRAFFPPRGATISKQNKSQKQNIQMEETNSLEREN
jgi:hypothetical protein